MLSHDINDKLESLDWAKLSDVPFKLVLINHLEIKDVVDKANKEIGLRYHDQNDASLSLVECHLQQALQEHQIG